MTSDPMADVFKAAMEARHHQNVADFGVPDRIILQEDVKMWRFSANLGKLGSTSCFFVWDDVIPVETGMVRVGSVSLTPINSRLGYYFRANATVSAEIPEKLDYDLGKDLSLLPVVRWEESINRWRVVSLVLAGTSLGEGNVWPMIDEDDSAW
jgi:hypothetical protein